MLGARDYEQRGLYPRGIITRIKQKSSKESTAVLIKTCFSFSAFSSSSVKMPDTMNRIHFNKIGVGGGGGQFSMGFKKNVFLSGVP